MEDDEKERLLRTYPPGKSGHGAIVGIPSTVLEPPNLYKSRWRSIRVMYLTMFLSSVSFSICMSSLWPYLKLLDTGANTDYLGWVVASYSLGQLIASPVFGGWATFRGKSREPLVVSMVINVLANVLYSYLESIPSNKGIYLIVSRALVGFGAGNVAVVRSYVSGATTLKERTAAMANMSAFQSIGFIIGPLIQIAMVPIGYPGIVHLESLHLDLYTSPAILSAIVGVINIILLFAVFREHHVDCDEDVNFSIQESSDKRIIPDYKPDYTAVISSIVLFFVILFIFAVFETIGTPLTMHMYAWTKSNATLYNGIILGTGGFIAIAVFIVIKLLTKRFNERYILLGGFALCLLGFFVYLPWGHNYPVYQTAVINKGGTIPPNVTDLTTSHNISDMTTNGWTDTTIADRTTVRHSHTSSPDISTLMSTESHHTSLVPTVTPTMYMTLESTRESSSLLTTTQNIDHESTITFQSSSLPDKLSSAETQPTSNVTKSADINRKFNLDGWMYEDEDFSNTTGIFLTTTDSINNHSKEHESVGCPDTYKWCSYTPIVSFPQFIIGTLLIVIGYPTCNVMSYTLYSKILGPKPQGMMMGWLTASGSLARTVGPIFVSQVYNAYGPRVTFICMVIIVFLTMIMYLFVFKRLKPFKFTQDVSPNTQI